MIRKIDIEEALLMDNVVYIDVRSPKEYKDDTIPTAINIPILTDEEREQVGYLYKQIDEDQAKELGLEYASKKLTYFYKEAKKIIEQNKVVALFCFRGGMRSNSIATVLDAMGLDVYIITGGYKSYRNYVIENLEKYKEKFKYVVLHGLTGVGKTKLLKLLKERSVPVLDIEGLARNSGSVFGSLAYEGKSNSQKTFESLLLQAFKEFDGRLVFTESESKRVGRVVLPGFLYENIQKGYHILINTTMKKRVENIKEDYINIETPELNEKLISSINHLRKRLGNKKVNELRELLEKKEYSIVIQSLMEDYYDPLYEYSIEKVGHYDMIIEYEDEAVAVDKLIEFMNNNDRDRKEKQNEL